MATFRQLIADWAKQWSTRTAAEFQAVRSYPRDVRFRIYKPSDEDACLEIYRSLEDGFPPNGTDDFLGSLRNPDNAFVVAVREGTVVGMGGISLNGEGTATLIYGLVSPAHQGSGIGTALALLRLCSLPSDDFSVIIYTLEKPKSFYRRLDFRVAFEWDDEHGQKHPAAMLDLAGFRRDFVLDILRTRGVMLEGPLVPRLSSGTLIDRFRMNDGSYQFKARDEGVPEATN